MPFTKKMNKSSEYNPKIANAKSTLHCSFCYNARVREIKYFNIISLDHYVPKRRSCAYVMAVPIFKLVFTSTQ